SGTNSGAEGTRTAHEITRRKGTGHPLGGTSCGIGVPRSALTCLNAGHHDLPTQQHPAPSQRGARPAGLGEKEPAMAEQDTPETTTHVPAPSEVPHTQPASTVPHAESHPDKWGRIDDEGAVFVRTADGERQVGVWQAGTAAEGLTHFARRFDDLRTEVELLETRLSSGAGDPKQALASATQLKEGLADAAIVGDIDALAAKLDEVIAHAQRSVSEVKEKREQARAEAVTRKQTLAEEAEQIAESSTQWKWAGDRLKAILDEWKTIKGVDRKTDDELWKRFSKAREAFNRRRGSHFAELDKQRAAAKRRKEELIEEAESMTDSTDWGPTAARYKQLMADWKA